MIRKMLLLVAATSLVVAVSAPANADVGLPAPAAAAAVSGRVATGPAGSAACPTDTYSHEGTFSGLALAGVFAGTTHSYEGIVNAAGGVTACINSIVTFMGAPVVNEGDIRQRNFNDNGTPSPVGNHCLTGDIDRGGFVTAGASAAVHFSLDYQVRNPNVNPLNCAAGRSAPIDSVDNISCVGAVTVVLDDVDNPLIGGAIGCLKA